MNSSDHESVLDEDEDGYAAADDCDDHNADIAPGLPERCNGIDDNCNDNIDEDLYPDEDGDGFGGPARPGSPCFANWTAASGDCNDGDPLRYPDAPERCDGVDNGCSDTWTEVGVVTWQPAEGPPVSFTERFLDTADPNQRLLPISEDGTLTFCGRAEPFPLALTAPQATSLITIRGRPVIVNESPLPAILTGGPTGDRVLDLMPEDNDWGPKWRHTTIRIEGIVVSGANETTGIGGAGLAVGYAEDLHVSDVMFESSSSRSNGGAVLMVEVGHAKFTDSRLIANTADESGGAVYAFDSDLSFTRTEFRGNTANRHGGALNAKGSEDQELDLYVTESIFMENVAGENGGAIGVQGEQFETSMWDTRLDSNHAEKGGAISTESQLWCTAVDDRTAGMHDNLADYHGGAVHIQGARILAGVSIFGCTFSGNAHDPNNAWGGRFADLSMPKPDGTGVRLFRIDGSVACLASGACSGAHTPDPENQP